MPVISVQVRGARPNLILPWSGTIDDIPSGWKLCDGSGGAPDLRDRFVIGTCWEHPLDDASRKFGQIGLAHIVHGHSTTCAPESSHTHYATDVTGLWAPEGTSLFHGLAAGGGTLMGPHGHAIQPGASDPGTEHTHPYGGVLGWDLDPDTGAVRTSVDCDNRPPYYALAYIITSDPTQMDLPEGMIGMTWTATGAPPSGYYICDGDNGTPDFYGKYALPATVAGGAGSELWSDGYTVSPHAHGVGTLVYLAATHNHNFEEDLADGFGNYSTYRYAVFVGSTSAAIPSAATVDWVGEHVESANCPTYATHYHNFSTGSNVHGRPPEGLLHFDEDGSHGHAITTIASQTGAWGQRDEIPSFYLHFVQRNADVVEGYGFAPVGCIAFWPFEGLAPLGWSPCDGLGTEPIGDRVLVAAGEQMPVGSSGDGCTTATVPEHSHLMNDSPAANPAHTHDVTLGSTSVTGSVSTYAEDGIFHWLRPSPTSHSHTISPVPGGEAVERPDELGGLHRHDGGGESGVAGTIASGISYYPDGVGVQYVQRTS